MNYLLILSAALSFLAAGTGYADSAGRENLEVSSACTANESWSGQGRVSKDALKALSALINGGLSPALGFARGLDLEKDKSTETRLLGYYMEGRALLLAGQNDAALENFSYIATSPSPSRTGSELQLAAVQCIAGTLRANPGMSVPASVASNLKSLSPLAASSSRRDSRDSIDELAFDVLLDQISLNPESATDADLRAPLDALKGTGPYEGFARGFAAARSRAHAQVIAALAPLLNPTNPSKRPSLPEGLKREETHALLLLARAYYATRQFPQANSVYQRIDRRSNEIAETLSELSWSYLQENRYSAAVGTAVSLRLGDMRNTFAPESLEVAAMSLNELCQYQDSLREVKTLERDYEASYRWLKNRAASNGEPSLYSLAIAHLKGDASDGAPSKVASEWIRSPVFLSGQSEIHRLFGVKARFITLLSDLKSEFSDAKKDQLDSLQQAVLTLQQRQSVYFEAADRTRGQWVARIEDALTRRNARMLSELDEVHENSRLVEIEIYNGASHDMIWLRAHSEFKKSDSRAVTDKNNDKNSAASATSSWNWGKVDPNSDRTEVWEDELGSFKAHLQDHCSDKDRYLGVKTAGR
jgi:hypothetical protein